VSYFKKIKLTFFFNSYICPKHLNFNRIKKFVKENWEVYHIMKQLILLVFFCPILIFSQNKNLTKDFKDIISKNKSKNHIKSDENYKLLLNYLNSPSEHFSSLENYCFSSNYALDELIQIFEPVKLAQLKKELSEGFHKLCFSTIRKNNTTLNDLSEFWHSLKLSKRNSWIDSNAYYYEYQDSLFKPIFNKYFNQLILSSSELDQDKILKNCLRLFPGINFSYGHQDQLLGKILMNGEGTGTITIFNQSYLSYYLLNGTNENSIEMNFANWLDPSVAFDPFVNVSKEILNFLDGRLVGKQSVYKKDKLFAEITYKKDDFNCKLQELSKYDNSQLIRTYFFHYPELDKINFSFYYYDFKDGINLSLSNYNQNLKVLSESIDARKKDDVELLISQLDSLNYPNNIEQVQKFEKLKNNWISIKNVPEIKSNSQVEQNCESARKKYLEQNQDVKNAGLDPMWHYNYYGKKEGRKWPACDEINNDLPQQTSNEETKSVVIGTQTWTTENLNVSTFRNGDPIPEARTSEDWINAGKNGKPAWCYYDNDSKNGEKYGKLYNWYAVNDPRGIAPEGWRIVTDEDWDIAIKFLGGERLANRAMKSKKEWLNGKNGSNQSGLTILPSGLRYDNGNFGYSQQYGVYWSNSSKDAKTAFYRYFDFPQGGISRLAHDKSHGFSVRCIEEVNNTNEDYNDEDIVPNDISILEKNNNVSPANLKSVDIGTQTWTSENLNVSTFRNGDPIPQVMTDEEWEKAGKEGKPAWCYYNNDPKNGEKYGKIYNWYAVNDPRGLAPNGWHVPSEDDWRILENHLGKNEAGKKLKATIGWDDYQEKLRCDNCSYWTDEQKKNNPCSKCRNTREVIGRTLSGNGTNITGFSASPCGSRTESGLFYKRDTEMVLWSKTNSEKSVKWSKTNSEKSVNAIIVVALTAKYNNLYYGVYKKNSGLSIRLIKND
jgi:uncharacterized protein (TIGR02145 family)